MAHLKIFKQRLLQQFHEESDSKFRTATSVASETPAHGKPIPDRACAAAGVGSVGQMPASPGSLGLCRLGTSQGVSPSPPPPPTPACSGAGGLHVAVKHSPASSSQPRPIPSTSGRGQSGDGSDKQLPDRRARRTRASSAGCLGFAATERLARRERGVREHVVAAIAEPLSPSRPPCRARTVTKKEKRLVQQTPRGPQLSFRQTAHKSKAPSSGTPAVDDVAPTAAAAAVPETKHAAADSAPVRVAKVKPQRQQQQQQQQKKKHLAAAPASGLPAGGSGGGELPPAAATPRHRAGPQAQEPSPSPGAAEQSRSHAPDTPGSAIPVEWQPDPLGPSEPRAAVHLRKLGGHAQCLAALERLDLRLGPHSRLLFLDGEEDWVAMDRSVPWDLVATTARKLLVIQTAT